MPIKPHPTDPDKMVYVKREYNLPKEWVGLTEKDIVDCFDLMPPKFARAIETKLKEKNT